MTIKTVQTLSTIWVVSIAINIAVLVSMMEEMDTSYYNALITNDIETCSFFKSTSFNG